MRPDDVAGAQFPLDRRFSVLVAEDDPVTLCAVRELLVKCGYDGAPNVVMLTGHGASTCASASLYGRHACCAFVVLQSRLRAVDVRRCRCCSSAKWTLC